MIFVYGANEGWRHGAGAAKRARLAYGAINGKGPFSGNSYGIPTKDKNLKVLSLPAIKQYVDNFIRFAQSNPDEEFYVTKVGTGLSKLNDAQVAPLFLGSPSNCIFDKDWQTYLPNRKYFDGLL